MYFSGQPKLQYCFLRIPKRKARAPRRWRKLDLYYFGPTEAPILFSQEPEEEGAGPGEVEEEMEKLFSGLYPQDQLNQDVPDQSKIDR